MAAARGEEVMKRGDYEHTQVLHTRADEQTTGHPSLCSVHTPSAIDRPVGGVEKSSTNVCCRDSLAAYHAWPFDWTSSVESASGAQQTD